MTCSPCQYFSKHDTSAIQLVPNYENADLTHSTDANTTNTFHSLRSSALRYLQTAECIFYAGQLLDKLPKWLNAVSEQCGISRFPSLDRLSEKGRTAWQWGTTFPRLPGLIRDTLKTRQAAEDALSDASLTTEQKKYLQMKASSTTAETCAFGCHSLGMIADIFAQKTFIPKVFNATGDSLGLGHDVLSFGMTAKELQHAYTVNAEGATPEMKATLAGTKTYNWIVLAKNTFSIITGTSGLILLATGVSMISGLFCLTLSLLTTLLGLTKSLYKEQMHFKPIKFLENPGT